MKLQAIAAGTTAKAQTLSEQAQADAASAQATGQTTQRDAALREALPSRRAANGACRTGRTAASVLRNITNTAQGSSAHASPRAQAMVVRQSDEMQIQDDGTEDSIALPDELDGAIADWTRAAVGNASVEFDTDPQMPESPSHRRVSRDERQQRQRGRQRHPQQEQEQEQELPSPATEGGHGKPSAQAGAEDLADRTRTGGQPCEADLDGELPWALQPGARSTARIAAIAATGSAQGQLAELESRLGAHESSSQAVAALMWALAAMVVAIIATLLLTVFSADEPDTEKEAGHANPGSHEVPRRDKRSPR